MAEAIKSTGVIYMRAHMLQLMDPTQCSLHVTGKASPAIDVLL